MGVINPYSQPELEDKGWEFKSDDVTVKPDDGSVTMQSLDEELTALAQACKALTDEGYVFAVEGEGTTPLPVADYNRYWFRAEQANNNQHALLCLSLQEAGSGTVETKELLSMLDRVGTDSIQNNAVTRDKIADNAVTVGKIAPNAVTSQKIAADAIVTDNIKNGAVTNEKLSDGIQDKLNAADGAVRYDDAQELTVAQQEQVSNNVGVPTVFMSESELNTALSDERAAKIANARIIMFTMNNGNTIPILRAYENNAQIYFQSWYTNHQYNRYQYDKSNKMTSYFIGELSDNYAVHFNSQNLTTSQQLQARTNIAAMANTPSGDPMHYIYETAGAEWIPYADISTDGLEDWQVATLDRAQAQSDGGVWWHNDIFVTVAQNRINYVSTIGNYPANATTYAFYLKRTNVTTNYKEDILVNNNISLSEAVRINETIRTVLLPTMPTNNIGYAFNNCARLCRVIGTINVSNVSSFSNTFVASPNLRYINLYGLNMNVDFSGNGKLSLKSLIFMITNAGTASFTITLAPAVYAAAMADTAVQAALAAKPNVTLADAGASSSGGN